MRSALLVPCYNAVRFLPRLRKQIERLSPGFDEVLLVDDASTDATAAMASALGFRILSLPQNIGPGGARNVLARAATAEWVHFHDVDDEIAPDYLERVLPAAVSASDVVFHFVDFIDEQTRKLIIRWKFDPVSLLADPQIGLLRGPMPTMSTFIRRDLFLKVGGFNEEYRCFEDGDMHFRLALNGARLAIVPHVLEWSLRHNRGAGENQHYCFKCRLQFLKGYAATLPSRFYQAIASEAERTALMLLRFNDKENACRAIELAERLGFHVPTTKNAMLKFLRSFFPARTLLSWQDRWRSSHR